ncbi:transcriptional regulator, TetR family [Streptoalloteichus hindustanus]|uniref:Transcriptional regulator, TetR family n=2 Tax=Streptoalloteichus hindustanus TaxID=2017 RepID=A0A1M4ZE88_STRHI|nr:transcriptional regulator, TetR family [Streptoalloteichus hindustanus]
MADAARQPRLRADAVRNRAAILLAARKLIAERGPDVGMDEIARAAHVAVGTLYRHFPTKTDLVGAIMADLGAQLVAVLDAAVARIDNGVSTGMDEIAALLRRVVVHMGQDRLLRAAAASAGSPLPDEVARHARDTLAHMVAAARRDGALHPDIAVDDLALLMATAPGEETPQPERERWVALALRALGPSRSG